MSYIHVDALTKQYGTGEAAVLAVRTMSFEIESGEFIGVMGESGSGKSTLLSMMGALNTPTSGHYTVDEIDVYGLTADQQADFRREFLGFVFQSFHLVPYLTVIENVMVPLTTIRMSSKEKRAMAKDALERVGIGSKSDRLPNRISGGEQERLAVARAIVNAPSILLADEPTGNLDHETGIGILNLFKQLNREGHTIVMVTHSSDIAEYASKIITLRDGEIVPQTD